MPLSAASLHRTRTCFTRRSPSAWRFMLGSMAPKAQLRHFSGGCPGHEAEPLHGKAAQARKKQQQLCKAASHEQQRMGDTRLGEVPLDGTQDSGVQQPVAFTHAANARRPTQWSHQPSNATKPARPTQSTSPKRRPRQRPQDYASERLPLPPYGALLPSTSPKHLDTSRVVLRLQQSRHWAVNQQMTNFFRSAQFIIVGLDHRVDSPACRVQQWFRYRKMVHAVVGENIVFSSTMSSVTRYARLADIDRKRMSRSSIVIACRPEDALLRAQIAWKLRPRALWIQPHSSTKEVTDWVQTLPEDEQKRVIHSGPDILVRGHAAMMLGSHFPSTYSKDPDQYQRYPIA